MTIAHFGKKKSQRTFINRGFQSVVFKRPFPFEDVLTILVSIFHLFSDERKECITSDVREKRGREDFYPNGIGL